MNEGKVRRDVGDPALNDFVFKMSRKGREELVEDAWRMERAESLLRNEEINCMEVLTEHAKKDNCECDGFWLRLALDLLDKNGIDPHVFSEAVRIPMTKGREKHVNLIIVGPADCAKTFILQPITKAIPNTFESPAKGMFGWLGVDKANAVFLNDLRWIPPNVTGFFVAWDDFLKLLEGKHVTLACTNELCIFAYSRPQKDANIRDKHC